MNRFKKGIMDGLPIGLGYLSVSFAFGMMAVGEGLNIAQAVLISLTNVTSAGQLAGLFRMVGGATLIETAIEQLIINLRYALMSVSLSQKLDDSMTTPHRAAFAFCNTDEIFAMASGQKGAVGKAYLYGLILLPYIGWALGTTLGAAAGTLLPEALRMAMSIAIYGMFIAIIIPPSKKDKAVRTAVILASLMSCAMYYTPALNRFSVIICAVTVSALCAWLFPVHEDAGEEAEG